MSPIKNKDKRPENIWVTWEDIKYMPGIQALIKEDSGGRCLVPPELFRDIAAGAHDAIRVIHSLMTDDAVRVDHPNVTLGAAKAMLDRALGRPIAPVRLDGDINVTTAGDIFARMRDRTGEETLEEAAAKAYARLVGQARDDDDTTRPVEIDAEIEAEYKQRMDAIVKARQQSADHDDDGRQE